MLFYIFFFNDTATTEIYTLSLHDALPIYGGGVSEDRGGRGLSVALERSFRDRCELRVLVHERQADRPRRAIPVLDRKSTRLNSSHANISYAVFCLKKKKKEEN